MARLRHVATGVVVDVSDAKAATLQGGGYEPAGEPEKPKATPRKAKADTTEDAK